MSWQFVACCYCQSRKRLDKTAASKLLASTGWIVSAYAANTKYTLPLRLRISRATKGAGDTLPFRTWYLVYEVSVCMTQMTTNTRTRTHVRAHARTHARMRTHRKTYINMFQLFSHKFVQTVSYNEHVPYMSGTPLYSFCKHAWV